MFGHETLYERRCNACGATWLLTKEEAHFRARRADVRAPIPNQPGLFDQTANMVQDAYEGQIELLDHLRSCPECQLESYTQHKVTKAKPASPDASRAALP